MIFGQSVIQQGNAPVAPKEGALLQIQEQLSNAGQSVQQAANRIASALNRIMPEPEGVAAGVPPEPNPQGHLNTLYRKIRDIEEAGKWLHTLADRLDKIG